MQMVENFVNAIFGSLMSMSTVSIVKMVIMWGIGGLLIFLAIKKEMEPSLLLPMGFGAILVNLPLSGAIDQFMDTAMPEPGPLSVLFRAGISNELFPLLLFIGIGAMIDFGPLLKNPKLLMFGAAAQFGIFFTILLAAFLGSQFPGMFSVADPVTGEIIKGLRIQDAAAIGIIGAADGPTSIFIAEYFSTPYLGAIIVAAYSYMALVPIIQPPCIKLVTTKKERMIRMPYEAGEVSKRVRILFPIVVTIIAGLVAPRSVALVGFLMFGNLLRECGVLNNLSETAQNALANLITIFLGITVATKMQADLFLVKETLIIMGLGLVAFVIDTIGGVLFAKFVNLFAKTKVNPMIGACGISAFPMSSRVIHKMGLQEDPQNFLLMHAAGVNVGGQIASVIAGGLVLNLIAR